MADPSDLQALERLVVDDDDLLALEESIGRFNVFDALQVANAEIRHSNFLAWLLDPSESHGQHDLFLKAILMDLLKSAPVELRPLSPVDLDGRDLGGVEVRREFAHIDLLLCSREPRFVVAIENKVESSEGTGQLARYEAVLQQQFADYPPLRVFLTAHGDEPTSATWIPYTYEDVHRVLTRCRRINAGSIGGDVGVVLDHYLRLIGSRFMDDSRVNELCQRIYKNHRQALDLIFERVQPGQSPLLRGLVESLEREADRWTIIHTDASRVAFVPATWVSTLPPIGTWHKDHQTGWIRWEVHVTKEGAFFQITVIPTSNVNLRRAVIEALISRQEEFRLKPPRKNFRNNWTQLCKDRIDSWAEDDEPDVESLIAKVSGKLSEWSTRLEKLPSVVNSITAATRK